MGRGRLSCSWGPTEQHRAHVHTLMATCTIFRMQFNWRSTLHVWCCHVKMNLSKLGLDMLLTTRPVRVYPYDCTDDMCKRETRVSKDSTDLVLQSCYQVALSGQQVKTKRTKTEEESMNEWRGCVLERMRCVFVCGVFGVCVLIFFTGKHVNARKPESSQLLLSFRWCLLCDVRKLCQTSVLFCKKSIPDHNINNAFNLTVSQKLVNWLVN